MHLPRGSRRLLLALSALLAGWTVPAGAQQGTIAGVVIDAATSFPVPDAQVQVQGPAVSTGALTNREGRFRIQVAPGTYTVVVEMIGYETGTVEGVQVGAGAVADVTLRMASRVLNLDPIQVTVGRKVEKATEAPATVAVVSGAKIEEKVVTTPIEHMKDVVGVDIINYGVSAGNVVVRGFNNIFSGALHFLTDHRVASIPSLNVNLMQFVPSTGDDMARMEVVLGPGSALYGPNTANGVLHILTKSPLDEAATTVSLAGGERSVFKGQFRTSHLLTEDFGVKLSGSLFRGDEWEYTDPVEAGALATIQTDPAAFRAQLAALGLTEAETDQRIARVGRRDFDIERWGGEARADWRFTDGGTAIVQIGRSSNDGIELTGLGAGQTEDWVYSYYQTRLNLGRLFAQAYLNTSDAGDSYLLRQGGTLVDRSRMWVAQLQHGVGVADDRLDLIYGLDYRRTIPESEGTISGQYEENDEITEFGAYAQADLELTESFDLIGALRFDDTSVLEESVWSPRAALVFTPMESQSFRLSYNRAFSTPTTLNMFLDINGGRAPGVLGDLGYLVRATGPGPDGLSFQDAAGNFRGMRSPFNPQPSMLQEVTSQNLWLNAVNLLQARGAVTAQQAQFFRTFDAAAVPINVFDPLDPTNIVRLDQAMVPDVPRLRESITTTYEIGYQGVVGNRLALAADVWTSTKDNFTSPLTLWTPLLLLDGPSLVPFLMQHGIPQQQAVTIAQNVGPVPLAVVSSPDVQTLGADLVTTYVNYGEVDLWGADLSAQAFLTDEWTLGVTGSLVSDDHFNLQGPGGVTQLVALNAPEKKGTATLGYRNAPMGFNGEIRVRYTDGFPANSAGFLGTRCVGGMGDLVEDCVESATVFDLTLGYAIPNTGATAQLYVSNLFDEGYRSFVGVPTIGRLALLQLKYDF